MDEKQTSLEGRARRLVDEIGREGAGGLCEMLAPRFVECNEREKSLTLAYKVMGWELNSHGTMHGGMVTALLDTTIGSIAACFVGKMTPTIFIQTSFMRPGLEGMELLVRARLLKLGRSIAYGTAEAWAADAPEDIVATATGAFKV